MSKFIEEIPGILLCVFLAFISKQISSITSISSLTIGIVLGIMFSNLIGLHLIFYSGVRYTLKSLLKLGIIFLGADLNFIALYSNGIRILLLAVIIVGTGVLLAPYVAKLFGFNDKLAMLLGVGSSICGASAIVATAPVIEADENDTALAVAIISLLGAIGVIVFPLIGSLLNMSDIQYGFWSGGSLQGVAHALAAAGAWNDLALEMATYVKMTRVVLLAPLTLFLIRWFNKTRSATDDRVKVKIPLYIILFILVGIISSIGLFNVQIIGQNLQGIIKSASSELILWAMIAMGLGVDLKKIKNVGAKALLAGSGVFLIVSLIAYVFVFFIF